MCILIVRDILLCYSQVQNHLIQRFLEDPLLLLSSIRDDDRLVAYKIPKIDKNTKYLQLIHRRREQYVSFQFKYHTLYSPDASKIFRLVYLKIVPRFCILYLLFVLLVE